VYTEDPNCTIVFLGRHFLFTSSDTFAVECIILPQPTAKTRTAEISASEIAIGNVVTWPWLFQTAFSAVRFCSYTVRRPWRQLRF